MSVPWPDALAARVERDVRRVCDDRFHPNIGDLLREWARDLADARRERDEMRQRLEWVSAALHPEPFFGRGTSDPLVLKVNVLFGQVATAHAEAEAARAAFQANPCGATCRQLLHVLEAHERTECEVCAALARELAP